MTKSGPSFSAIDHIYTNSPVLYKSSGHFSAFGSSYHLIFAFRKKLKISTPPLKIIFRSLRKVDWPTLENELPTSAPTDIDSFNNEILSVLDRHAPLKSKLIKGTQKPWLNPQILDQAKLRDNQKKTFEKTKDQEEFKKFQSLRNEVNVSVTRAKTNYTHNKLNESINSSSCWSTLAQLTGSRKKSNTSISSLLDDEGLEITNNEGISHELCNSFMPNCEIATPSHKRGMG